MGLSRTSWAVCLAAACLGPLAKYNVVLRAISYPYPDGAMNIASNDFLLSGADEMLVIDTDIGFDPEHIEFLFSHDEPLVFGMYPRKQAGLVFPMELLGEENPFAANPLMPGFSPLVEVKRTARGFMRMKREVLEQMKGRVSTFYDAHSNRDLHEFWKNLPGGHSEDFSFCDQWRALGGRIIVDQRVTAKHEGTATYPIKGTY